MLIRIASIPFIYASIFTLVAVLLRAPFGYERLIMPITVAIWIFLWRKIENFMNDFSLKNKIFIYALALSTHITLDTVFIAEPVRISFENFWLTYFSSAAIATIVLSIFWRASRSKRHYPQIIKYAFYGIFVLGTVLVSANLINTLLFPPTFS